MSSSGHTLSMRNVLVIGSDGQLGGEFMNALGPITRAVGVDRPQVDVCDPAAVSRLVRSVVPDTLVNCTAWNAVDQAEREPLAALATNAFAVRTLAELATEVGATLVHFSSDFVFDGESRAPYRETDQPNPLSTYGMSKLLGEVAAQTAARHYVLRLSSLYGGARRVSYIDVIARALQAGVRVPVFIDRTVSPSYSPEVVDATLRLIASGAPAGVYHCASPDWCNWLDLGLEVARLMRADPSLVEGVPFGSADGRARRPRRCAMDCGKLRAWAGSSSGWGKALAKYLAAAHAPAGSPSS